MYDIQDKATIENVIFGHFNSRRFELLTLFERGLLFESHSFSRSNKRRFQDGF